MFGAALTLPNASAVNQTFNRVETGKNYALYVNDTARAAGIYEVLELRATPGISKKSSVTPNTVNRLGRWNAKFTTKLSTEAEPNSFSLTITRPDALESSISTLRTRLKDHRAYATALIDADAEIDDVGALRTL